MSRLMSLYIGHEIRTIRTIIQMTGVSFGSADEQNLFIQKYLERSFSDLKGELKELCEVLDCNEGLQQRLCEIWLVIADMKWRYFRYISDDYGYDCSIEYDIGTRSVCLLGEIGYGYQ